MEILNNQFVYTKTKFKTMDEIFSFAAKQLYEKGRTTEVDAVIRGFEDRESGYSTYAENGVAIPHCKITQVKQATVMILQNSSKVAWTDADEYADLIILLAVPGEGHNDLHLKMLAKIAQKLVNEEFVQRLKSLSKADDIVEAFADIKEVR